MSTIKCILKHGKLRLDDKIYRPGDTVTVPENLYENFKDALQIVAETIEVKDKVEAIVESNKQAIDSNEPDELVAVVKVNTNAPIVKPSVKPSVKPAIKPAKK